MKITTIENLKAIDFAKWIGENHYYLYNVSKGVYYWKSESLSNENHLTTDELFLKYEKQIRVYYAKKP